MWSLFFIGLPIDVWEVYGKFLVKNPRQQDLCYNEIGINKQAQKY